MTYKKNLWFTLIAVLPLLALNVSAGNIVLNKNTVGAKAMPAVIEDIAGTPFKMKTPERPTFPDRTVTVNKGSIGADGKITEAINGLIADISKRGGGTVKVPSGHWMSGRIVLKSNVNLHLEEGAVIEFSGSIDDYQPAVFTRHEGIEIMGAGAFIYANKEKNIALTGKGTIMGPPMSASMRTLPNGKSVVENDVPHDMPVKQRICDGYEGRTFYRPKSFSPINCKNVLIEGVTLERGLYWNMVPQYCENVIMRGVTVSSFGHGRTDGIDIDSSRGVLIEYCSLDCQDDCYTMKSGRGEDGLRVNRPTENVVIRKSIALRGAGGIVCGTETAGGVRNVYMADCVFDGKDQAFRFKTRRPRGGFVENVYVERVRADVKHQAFYCDMLGSAKWVGELAKRYPAREVTKLTPWFRNISIHDVEITACRQLVDVGGLPEKVLKNVFFGNVKARCEKIGRVRDASKFSMKDVRVETTDSVLEIDNCDFASFFGFSNTATGRPVDIRKTGGECRYMNVQAYPLAPVTYNSIRPGEVWLDTEGKPIQAHGFQVTRIGDKYYWYGEDSTIGTERTRRTRSSART